MKRSAAIILFSALAPLFTTVTAQQTCNITSPCGEAAPCCSDFGFCSEDFCRGGCNPLKSFAPTSCTPLPMCESKTYTFTDTSRIINATQFDGNVSRYDWTIDNPKLEIPQHIGISQGNLALFLSEANQGTRISTTRYVHYGRVTATMQVGRWDGVITTFIGMSDPHDEIDWEFPGKGGATEGQSNWFWLGVIVPDNGGYHKMTDDFHDYTIDWSPDRLNWEIDGKVVRTLRKADTLNQNDGVYHYPTTPMRVQLSIWPAGIPSSPKGVIEWSGGMINWNDPDYKAAGHFYMQVKKLVVDCNISGNLAPPADALTYVYGANVSGIPSVAYSNESAMSAAPPPTYIFGLRNLAPLMAAAIVALAALVF